MGGQILELESERLLREGREKGLAEGRAEGRADIIRNMLDSGMAPEDIARICNMDLEEVKTFEPNCN